MQLPSKCKDAISDLVVLEPLLRSNYTLLQKTANLKGTFLGYNLILPCVEISNGYNSSRLRQEVTFAASSSAFRLTT
jgi:hypothetical protein